MLAASQYSAAGQLNNAISGYAPTIQTGSTGTGPSSLCSTPVGLYNPNQSLLNYMPTTFGSSPFPNAGGVRMSLGTGDLFAQLTSSSQDDVRLPMNSMMQLPAVNALEGMPIFVVPGGIQTGVSLAALQRAAESKSGMLSTCTEPKVDTSKHYHIFIGDLSPEVDAKIIKDAFTPFGEVSEAKVIRDAQTQKSRGFGFVSFPEKEHAEKAMVAMNGQVLGRRAIRTNWATRRPSEDAKEKLTFEQVFNSTKADNTSVYVGNVCQNITDNDLREAFKEFGTISEVRMFKTQSYAFVRFEKKEHATRAIMEMNGKIINGNIIRCSWGRTQQNNQQVPLLTDYSPLLASQQLIQPSALTAQLNATLNPYWNAQQATFQHYINPITMQHPLLPQW